MLWLIEARLLRVSRDVYSDDMLHIATSSSTRHHDDGWRHRSRELFFGVTCCFVQPGSNNWCRRLNKSGKKLIYETLTETGYFVCICSFYSAMSTYSAHHTDNMSVCLSVTCRYCIDMVKYTFVPDTTEISMLILKIKRQEMGSWNGPSGGNTAITNQW